MKSYHIVSLNSYHIVSLHLKIVHYWIFCICMHLDHAYHVIFQIKIIWIWKMFDLQLTNASRLKHLFNQFYRFLFLELIFNSCMDISGLYVIYRRSQMATVISCVLRSSRFTIYTWSLYIVLLILVWHLHLQLLLFTTFGTHDWK